jgi:hypothetical protein
MASLLEMFRKYLPTWGEVRDKPSAFAPSAHKASHEDGGGDEIDVTGLVGTTPRAILGDGTEGRVLRRIGIWIQDGTNANTIKPQGVNIWNSNDITEEDNLEKNGDTGNFALNINGRVLTIQTSGFTNNAIAIISADMAINGSNIYRSTAATILAGSIRISLYDLGAAGAKDLTALVDEGPVLIYITYITNSGA